MIPVMTETPVEVRHWSTTEINDGEWMEEAACRGKTHMMFPNGHKDITYIVGARRLCRVCPVIDPCREYALMFPHTDMHGVWAKMTPRQLGAEQKRRGIQPVKPTLAKSWGDGK
jgi:hypothetical protein